MSGDVRQYQHRGLVPRAIAHVFKEIDMRVDKLYKVKVRHLDCQASQGSQDVAQIKCEMPSLGVTLSLVG